MDRKDYRRTIGACLTGYVAQAIINNFVTLLYAYFRGCYNLSYINLATISAFNFSVQITVDLLSSCIVRRIGCRRTVVLAHIFAGMGLVFMAVLPEFIPPFAALITASGFYAAGGGLIEVMISPIAEACPTPMNKKAKVMSFLHSFYCWGQLITVFVSTVFFFFFKIENWFIMALIWSLLPFLNAVAFIFVPITPPPGENGGIGMGVLIKNAKFRLFMLIMICSGACELILSQWASAFAQEALGLSKTLGDITVPCVFAAVMGVSRIVSSGLGDKINLKKYMLFCAAALIIGYSFAAFSKEYIFGIIGCAVCGFAVGVLWPGTYSVCAKDIPEGGIPMFSLLAFAGDIGCCLGPLTIGVLADIFNGNLKMGMTAGVFFSLVLAVSLIHILNKSD